MKILFVDINENCIFSFRKELLDQLIKQGQEIYLATKFSSRLETAYKNKVHLINLDTRLNSLAILDNFSLIRKFKKLVKTINPDYILSFGIKPNIYSNLKKHNAISIANITGLGNGFNKNGIVKKAIIYLYKKSFKNVNYVMFQNVHSYEVFKKCHIPVQNYSIIPGSGVNLDKFKIDPIISHDGTRFLFASRFIKQKGIDLLLKAIPTILNENEKDEFIFIGDQKKYKQNLLQLKNQYGDSIKFLDKSDEMNKIYNMCDFLVSPSFYNEGISNVLLESLACGRPIITTNDNPGCMEVIIDGINGFSCKSNDLNSLISTLEKASKCTKEQIAKMGEEGRQFVSKNFNRNTTISIYMDYIK